MDVLKHKKYRQSDYLDRYNGLPFYYHSEDNREFFGMGTNLLKDTPWALHKVTPEDTLAKLALKYYNNPLYWWVIAFFNDINDAFVKLSDQYATLKIPTISMIKFGVLR